MRRKPRLAPDARSCLSLCSKAFRVERLRRTVPGHTHGDECQSAGCGRFDVIGWDVTHSGLRLRPKNWQWPLCQHTQANKE